MTSQDSKPTGRPAIFGEKTKRFTTQLPMPAYQLLEETATAHFGGSVALALASFVKVMHEDEPRHWAMATSAENMAMEKKIQLLHLRVVALEDSHKLVKEDFADFKRSIQSTLQQLNGDERPKFQSVVKRLKGLPVGARNDTRRNV